MALSSSRPSPPAVLTLSILAALSSATALSALPANPEPRWDLVALAQPRQGCCAQLVAPTGPAEVAYDVVEVFAGEPPGLELAVRHDSLSAADWVRLRSGERVILLAARPASQGIAWSGPVPLRASEPGIDAFREWGAPADVRPAAPLSAVVARASDVEFAPRGLPPSAPEAVPPSAPEVIPPSAPEVIPPSAPEVIPPSAPEAMLPPAPAGLAAEGTPAGQPADRFDRSRVIEDDLLAPASRPAEMAEVSGEPAPATPPPPVVNRLERPAPVDRLERSARPAPVAPAPTPPTWDRPAAARLSKRTPPLTWDPVLWPHPGPGLLPPPPAESLGPPLRERTDLVAATEAARSRRR